MKVRFTNKGKSFPCKLGLLYYIFSGVAMRAAYAELWEEWHEWALKNWELRIDDTIYLRWSLILRMRAIDRLDLLNSRKSFTQLSTYCSKVHRFLLFLKAFIFLMILTSYHKY